MRAFTLVIFSIFLSCSYAQSAYDVDADSVVFKNGTLVLTGHVSFTFDHTVISGEHATYSSDTVILAPSEESPFCTIANNEGLFVKMIKAIYTPETEELILIDPKGEMTLEIDGVSSQLHFQSDQLLWDQANQELTFIDNVKIEAPKIASLVNDDRLSLKWSDVDGKRVLTRITSSGKSKIQRYDEDGDACFIVEDEGVTHYDINAGRVSFSSNDDKEIHYYDRLGHVFGRELFADLPPNTIAFAPQKVYLNRNVKLLTGVIVVEGEVQGATQYVLADSLVLEPKANTLVMESDEKNRVLFCDRMNHMQMSAPKLVMKKSPGLERPTVKGIGDVRFRLMEQELEQIKKRFYLDEEEQES